MSIYGSYPQQSLKRTRQEDDPVYQFSQKISRLDNMTIKEARHVFLESDPTNFQNALELESCGDLHNIHSIHKKAGELLDPSQRKDRAVLRMIKKIPDALPVKNFVSPEQSSFLQKYFFEKPEKIAHLSNHVTHRRIMLEPSWDSHVVIARNKTFEINSQYTGIKEIKLIYENILENVLKSICTLDGERAIGNYRVEFYITRYFEVFNQNNNFPLHHDRYRGHKPFTFPRYTFVGMLGDKKGPHGWKGGDLIVQNDSSSRF